jgi:hypothetical protein
MRTWKEDREHLRELRCPSPGQSPQQGELRRLGRRTVDAVRARISAAGPTDEPRARHPHPRRRLVGITAAGAALAAAAAVARDLGSTPALVAPANAKSLRELRHVPPQR